jgi:1-acyl-sn-glycerol-3-phosphate acyltransferase
VNDKNPDLSNAPRNFDFIKKFWWYYIGFLGLSFEHPEYIPLTGGAIIAANHVTLIDPFAVGQPTPRRVHFMSKKENFNTPLQRWFQYSGNAFPVDRGKPDINAVKTALRILKGGQLLVIFPQGTRNGQAAKDGVGLFAARAKVPVIPAGIILERNWFGGKRFRIRYGPPILPEGNAEEITSKVMLEIENLIGKPGSLTSHYETKSLPENQ